jgi:hypothetical protein
LAKVSVYVSDEVKARMDAAGERTNWSEVLRPALLARLALNERRKDQSLVTTTERLRASRAEYLSKIEAEAVEAGRRWAGDEADYQDLIRLAAFDPRAGGVSYRAMKRVLDPQGELSDQDFTAYLGLDDVSNAEMDDFLGYFVDGAQALYREVANQL